MLVVPLDSAANRAVVAVVDALILLPGYVGLLPKLVEENVEALFLTLGEAD